MCRERKWCEDIFRDVEVGLTEESRAAKIRTEGGG